MSSSSLTTYDLTVPIFVRNLEQLVACLKKGEEWAKDNNKDPQVLADASIIDDMKVRSNYLNHSLHIPAHDFFPRLTLTHTQQPLTFQIQSCCNTSKAVLPRIGGEEAVSVEDNETTLSQLLARLESTIKILRSAKKDKFLAPVRSTTYILFVLYVISLFPHPTRFFPKKLLIFKKKRIHVIS